jgi:hypothetical protein
MPLISYITIQDYKMKREILKLEGYCEMKQLVVLY